MATSHSQKKIWCDSSCLSLQQGYFSSDKIVKQVPTALFKMWFDKIKSNIIIVIIYKYNHVITYLYQKIVPICKGINF